MSQVVDHDLWIYRTLWRLGDAEKPACAIEPPPAKVFRRMLAIARVHRVLGLVMEKVQNLAADYPEEWATAERCWRAELVRSLRLRKHANFVMQSFAVAGIPATLLKGMDFADRLYPHPRLRPTAAGGKDMFRFHGLSGGKARFRRRGRQPDMGRRGI